MKKLLLGLTLLASMSSFASDIAVGKRVIYFNAFQTAIVGTVEKVDEAKGTLSVNIDENLATGLVRLKNVVAVSINNCQKDDICVGDVYMEHIEDDQYSMGEVKEVFSNGWRVGKEENSLFESIVHSGNLLKL
jgi:hypothetical protein